MGRGLYHGASEAGGKVDARGLYGALLRGSRPGPRLSPSPAFAERAPRDEPARAACGVGSVDGDERRRCTHRQVVGGLKPGRGRSLAVFA
jgi:hypothetical protein